MRSEEIICKSNRNFSFLIGQKSPYDFATNNFFFHSEKFLAGQDVVSFLILNNKEQLCEGVFNLSILENIGFSPLKAPFGSIDINSNISPSILIEFLDVIIDWCEENDLSAIKIKHYPQCYNPEGSALVENLLFNGGFNNSNSDLSQYIDVFRSPHVFNKSARIKINKCKKAGFLFRRLDSSKLAEVFCLIRECKHRKGYPMNMELHEIEKAVRNFPERYPMFGVENRDRLVSASICVVVNPKILYDFAHGHLGEFDKFSPVNLLVEGILEFCIENHYKILDLGLSTFNSIINLGLFEFKSRLDTLLSIKPSYTRSLF